MCAEAGEGGTKCTGARCSFAKYLVRCCVDVQSQGAARQHASTHLESDNDSDALRLKEEGNSALQRQEHAVAISLYTQALSQFSLLPALLNNLAAAQLKRPGAVCAVAALSAALAASAFQPSNIKAFFWAATAASRLSMYQAASDCVSVGLRHNPNKRELMQLGVQLGKMSMTQRGVQPDVAARFASGKKQPTSGYEASSLT